MTGTPPSKEVQAAQTDGPSVADKLIAAQHHERIFAFLHQDHQELSEEEFTQKIREMVDEIGNDVQRRYWKPREGSQLVGERVPYDPDTSDEEDEEDDGDGDKAVASVTQHLEKAQIEDAPASDPKDLEQPDSKMADAQVAEPAARSE